MSNKMVHLVSCNGLCVLVTVYLNIPNIEGNPYVLAYGTEDEVVRSAISTSEIEWSQELERIRVLGEGAAAVSYLCMWTSSVDGEKQVVVKQYKHSFTELTSNNLWREVDVLEGFNTIESQDTLVTILSIEIVVVYCVWLLNTSRVRAC